MDKPDVDSIEGLSPAISIDQKTTSRNPRSTVGTVTEIYDYLRLLWARIGHPHCHICGKPIAGQSAEQIIDQVMELEEGTRFMVLAPLVRGRKGEYGKVAGGAARRGLLAGEDRRRAADARGRDRARQEVQARHLDRRRPPGHARRPAQAPGRLDRDGGRAGRRDDRDRDRAEREPGPTPTGTVTLYSEKFACPDHGPVIPELEPRIFSFNSPHGACPRCTGPGLADGDRPRARRARPVAVDRRGRAGAVGGRRRRSTTSRSPRRSPRSTTSTSRRRGSRSTRTCATSSSAAPTATGSRSPTATATGASARTRRASRASSPTSSAATARPTPISRARRSRSSCRCGRARRARARG